MYAPYLDGERDYILQLAKDGYSASQIAHLNYKRFKTVRTRSAIIGVVNRAGFCLTGGASGRGGTKPDPLSKAQRRLHTARTRSRNPLASPRSAFQAFLMQNTEPYVPPAEEIVIPPSERKTVQTLEDNDCRWPIGDPLHADFHFCGKHKIDGLPYCEHHARRAFQPPQPKQRRQPPTPIPTFQTHIDETVN